MNLIFATNNSHKLQEAHSILKGHNILSLKDIGFTGDIEENGLTLEENSIIKCDAIYRFAFCNPSIKSLADGCFADDTGLEIAALNGVPGVRTARWAGEDKDDAANRKKALYELQNHSNRQAQFRTVISFQLFTDNCRPMLFEGIVKGSIALEESGDHGFGYDPIFIPENYENTFAQLPAEVKNTISHRARALTKMQDYLSNPH